MRVRHYYHCYAAGAWSVPVREHFTALGEAGLRPDTLVIGLVGPDADREPARERIRIYAADLGLQPDFTEAVKGWEQVTLQRLRGDVHAIPGDYAVLYAHTKGAADGSDWNTVHRQSMTRHVIGQWRDCLAALDAGSDTAGCHWLTPEEHSKPGRVVTTPMHGGNFWWATASYLRTLPEPATGYRHQAEEWVGLGGPKAHDLLPGWPTWELCGGSKHG